MQWNDIGPPRTMAIIVPMIAVHMTTVRSAIHFWSLSFILPGLSLRHSSHFSIVYVSSVPSTRGGIFFVFLGLCYQFHECVSNFSLVRFLPDVFQLPWYSFAAIDHAFLLLYCMSSQAHLGVKGSSAPLGLSLTHADWTTDLCVTHWSWYGGRFCQVVT